MLPRDEFAGKSTNGEWGDCLLMLDHDFGVLLDKLDELRIANDTIVVFCGDNGAEDHLAGRGTGGFFDGSYFSSAEGGIRTPLLIRWPGKVKAGTESNEMDDEDLDSFVDTLARRLASFDREVLTSRGQGANQSVRHADSYRASVEQRHDLPNADLAQCAGPPSQAPWARLRSSERLRIELRPVPPCARRGGSRWHG